jgi:hypothetical protein
MQPHERQSQVPLLVRLRRHESQLLHHAYIVRANPDLHDFAIPDAVYCRLCHRNLPTSRRHALKLARVNGMERQASHDFVAFSDLVLKICCRW